MSEASAPRRGAAAACASFAIGCPTSASTTTLEGLHQPASARSRFGTLRAHRAAKMASPPVAKRARATAARPASQRVVLNVGGQNFVTTLPTVSRSTYLTGMIDTTSWDDDPEHCEEIFRKRELPVDDLDGSTREASNGRVVCTCDRGLAAYGDRRRLDRRLGAGADRAGR